MTTVRELGSHPSGARRYVVARTGDVPEGGRLLVEVDGREVGIFNIGGKFYALLNRCPHRAGPLCQGEVSRMVVASKVGEITLDDRIILTCTWHAWEFDIRTGQSYWDPGKTKGRLYPVEVESGEKVARELADHSAQWLPGPYVADVVQTSVEDDYVIVAMRPQVVRTETDAGL